jgi:outer membrane protein OmpA-like peptidoglycan-associated protein
MQSKDDESSFWTSYADLLTGLFIVTLVLFVVSYKRLTAERDRLRVNAANYDRLQQLELAIRALADKDHFEYQPQYKRYVLRRQVEFARGKDDIDPRYDDYLRDTGKAIASLVDKLQADPSRRGIRYLILIEGMASRDAYSDNYGLSYRRALALYSFWRSNHIAFDPEICEVIIAGSGVEGIGRYSGTQEYKNQRFLIQIMPKVNF